MASLNKVMLIGNLTKDPELRHTPSGAAVAEFGLAMNRRFKSAGGDMREETCFVNVTVWGKRGEACAKYLHKGSQALVEGRLKYDEWEDKDSGKKRSRISVVCENWEFMDPPRKSDSGGGAQSAQSSPPADSPPNDFAAGGGSGGDDDDLPF